MPTRSCARRIPSGDRSLYPGLQAGELDTAWLVRLRNMLLIGLHGLEYLFLIVVNCTLLWQREVTCRRCLSLTTLLLRGSNVCPDLWAQGTMPSAVGNLFRAGWRACSACNNTQHSNRYGLLHCLKPCACQSSSLQPSGLYSLLNETHGMQMGGRMPAEDDARLAQRLQEEFNSSSGSRPKRSAASEAKKRLAEVRIAP